MNKEEVALELFKLSSKDDIKKDGKVNKEAIVELYNYIYDNLNISTSHKE